MWNRDEVRGKADQMKARVKEGVGSATRNERHRGEGMADLAKGSAQESFGKGRRRLGNAVKKVGSKIGR
jgi:uncharacterized protein YjbJ (UPF0337 family)